MLYLNFFVLIAAAVVLVILSYDRKRDAALKNIAAALQGKTAVFSLFPVVKGAYQGFNYSVTLVPASRSSPPQLIVRLIKPTALSLRIYRETLLNSIAKKLRLVNEIQINDPSFDREFLIFSNRPVQAVHFLNSSAKETLRQFFGSGFTSFVLGAGGAAVVKLSYTDADVEPAAVGELLKKLLSLASNTA